MAHPARVALGGVVPVGRPTKKEELSRVLPGAAALWKGSCCGTMMLVKETGSLFGEF